MLASALAVGCNGAGVHQPGGVGGESGGESGGAGTDAGIIFMRYDGPPPSFDGSIDAPPRVVGGAPLGDAACAAQTQKAEKVPLDMYVMLDSSGSMDELTASGQSKWDAIVAALTTFLRDPSSAGLGVGLQYFPLTKPGVPDTCMATADCGASGPCNMIRACLKAGTACATNADCKRGDTCELVGGCTLVNSLCQPVGGFCGLLGGDCAPLDGYCDGRDICASASYAAPAVEVAPLPGAAAGLVASLMAHMPDGLTPTSGALTGAIAHAQALSKANNGHRVVVLLATDGLPSECAPFDVPGVTAIAAGGLAGAPSISTFVVGVFAPEEQAQAQPALDAIAAAGGTKQSFIINVGQDVEQAFLAALNSVRTAALSCQFKVPAAGAGQKLDYYSVNVQYTSGAGQAVTIGNVHDKAACDARQGGWYYDVDPATGTPQTISMCDTSCAALRGDAAGRVDVLVGCKTETIIP
ncbi:MAG TPA: hypothetical protein VMT47_15300 [Polyangia bacterium]|nr:hypothetical protein [Polyangia bacterium]